LAAVNARYLGQACGQLEQQLRALGNTQEWAEPLAEFVKNLERMLMRFRNAGEHRTDACGDNTRSRPDKRSEDEE
jgi:HPt (histidine-containing phosphotransfer) domain-containing protein